MKTQPLSSAVPEALRKHMAIFLHVLLSQSIQLYIFSVMYVGFKQFKTSDVSPISHQKMDCNHTHHGGSFSAFYHTILPHHLSKTPTGTHVWGIIHFQAFPPQWFDSPTIPNDCQLHTVLKMIHIINKRLSMLLLKLHVWHTNAEISNRGGCEPEEGKIKNWRELTEVLEIEVPLE